MREHLGGVLVLAAVLTLGMAIGHGWSEWGTGRPAGAATVDAADTACPTVSLTAAEKPKADRPRKLSAAKRPGKAQRFGSVIGVKPEKLDEYVRLHANTWPEVLATIEKCNIHNYSIYLGKLDDGNLYLFAYFEYTGDDFEADMKRMAADPKTQEWWKLTDPCQIAQKERKEGEHWMKMREVFHTD
jgi:L-rhamnose mutarotase